MKKIGVFCLGTRRPTLWEAHARELSKCEYDNFHFYLLVDDIKEEYAKTIVELLPGKVTIVSQFPKIATNYLTKLATAVNQGHEYSVKHDEDSIMTSAGWDRFFTLIESMTDSDIFCTGAISNGIPTTELFIENHIPNAKEQLYSMFANIKLGDHGADYRSLNVDSTIWDSDAFYSRVSQFNHHYKGIHPVRVSFDAVKLINDEILKNFKKVMKPKDRAIIRDSTKYPYFCNNIFGIKTIDWVNILKDGSLYVDNFDEVPINKYRNNTKRNLVIDTGLPIIHTMYNWTPNWEYENSLIDAIKVKLKEIR
jgi:hypothetical protein